MIFFSSSVGILLSSSLSLMSFFSCGQLQHCVKTVKYIWDKENTARLYKIYKRQPTIIWNFIIFFLSFSRICTAAYAYYCNDNNRHLKSTHEMSTVDIIKHFTLNEKNEVNGKKVYLLSFSVNWKKRISYSINEKKNGKNLQWEEKIHARHKRSIQCSAC